MEIIFDILYHLGLLRKAFAKKVSFTSFFILAVHLFIL